MLKKNLPTQAKSSDKPAKVETKSENKQAVYRFIHTNKFATKQELYTGLNLSMPTIKQSLEYLQERSLIGVSKFVRNTGGRNAASYSVNYKGRFAAGVYLTNTHISSVCVDLSGDIFYKKKTKVPLNSHDDNYLKQIAESIEDMINESGMDKNNFLGVGIAVPSLVSEDRESVIFGMVHDFAGITRSILSKYIPYPTKLFHDSFVAGFAEVWKTPHIDNAVYLNINNTIGGSIIINNRIYKGNNNRSGEVGHMIMYPKSEKRCICGQRGCFDTVCNANVLDVHTGGSLEEFFARLQAKEPEIMKIWDEYLDNLAIAVHNFRMLYDCEIILGGYIGSYIEDYMNDLCRRVDALDIFKSFSREYVIPCRYKNEATAAGAAIQMIESFIHTL